MNLFTLTKIFIMIAKTICRIKTIAILLLAPFFIHAQLIQKNTKSNITINYERLLRIDTLVNEYLKNNWLTGAVTIVVKDNQLIQYKGYGYADYETKKPMTNDAIFRIMSQTK